MRSITAKELPEWFMLSRYEQLNRMEVRDWLPNLFIRAKFLDRNILPEEYRNEIEGLFNESENPPLICGFGDKDIRQILESDGADPAKQLETSTVRSMPAGHEAHAFNTISAGESKLARRLARAAENLKSGEIDEELDNLLKQPIDLLIHNQSKKRSRSAYHDNLSVDVNLQAPDKVIIDDFSRWLKAARSEFKMPAQKLFTKAKSDDLIAYGVLPYLDLTLWAALEQVRIPYAVMADALFPDAGVDTPYRVRRVTKRYADWAIQWSVIAAFYRQIVS